MKKMHVSVSLCFVVCAQMACNLSNADVPADVHVKDAGPDTPDLTPAADAATDADTTPDLAKDQDPGQGDESADMPAPVDCSAIQAREGWQLCDSTPTSCSAVFTDSAGCDTVCAAVGLECAQVFEDIDGQCQPDTQLPALTCQLASGHISDFCVCGAPSEATCGDGQCSAGETCRSCEADCGACPAQDYKSLINQAVGFARPTGGAAGPRVFVTNLNPSGPGSLSEAVNTPGPKWISFKAGLSGTITPVSSGQLNIPSDTTIDGRGANITLARGLRMRGSATSNIILHNLRFNVTDGSDAITVRDGPDNIWIDHCSFEGWGDGAIDITNGVAANDTNVTVSWVSIPGGERAMLVSATSDPSSGNVDEHIYITHHHNHYVGVRDRLPRARFAKVHVFNTVIEDWRGYAVGASTLAQILLEHNIFDADSDEDACIADCIGGDCAFYSGMGGAIRSVNNVFDQGRIEATCEAGDATGVFNEFPGATPPYIYSPEPANDELRRTVKANAGWRDVPLPP